MSDDEKESDSVGPNIDLEKIANESNAEGDSTADGDTAGGTGTDAQDGHGDEVEAHSNAGDERHDDHGHDDHAHDDEPSGRTTAPQSDFSMRQAAIGGLVTLVGLVVAYAVPGLLA